MKNGRPSLVFDIRFFAKGGTGRFPEHAATAFGNRLAWYLNSEGLSLGSFPSLYVRFSPNTPDGCVTLSEGGEWWHRYADVPMGASSDEGQISISHVQQGAVEALKHIRPDAAALIDKAYTAVAAHGPELRFLVRRKVYKAFTLDVATTISAGPEDSLLVAALRHNDTGQWVELPPFATGIHWLAFEDAQSLKLSDIDIEQEADGSFSAKWSASGGLPLPTVGGRVLCGGAERWTKRVTPRR